MKSALVTEHAVFLEVLNSTTSLSLPVESSPPHITTVYFVTEQTTGLILGLKVSKLTICHEVSPGVVMSSISMLLRYSLLKTLLRPAMTTR